MKFLRNPIIRAVAAVVAGALLLKYAGAVLNGLTIALGIVFLVAGVISLLGWVNARRQKAEYKVYDASGKQVAGEQPMFPIAGLGSTILGIIMAISNEMFVVWAMYLLAAILILGALNLFMNLMSVHGVSPVHPAFWVSPAVIMLAGIFAMIKGLVPPETTTMILGIDALLFAVTEVVFLAVFYKRKKALEQSEMTKEKATEVANAVIVAD